MAEHDDIFSQSVAEVGGIARESKFIGIPDDYQGPFARRETPSFPGMLPRPGRVGLPSERGFVETISPYTQKDALEIMGWDTAEVGQLQRIFQVLGAPFGFSSGQKWISGIADPPTVGKWRALLGFANQKGVTWQEAVSMLAASGGAGGGGGRQRAPFVARLSNPDDLRRVFQAAAKHLIGREVEASQADGFISSFQGQERSAQRKAYSAAESGGSVTSPPDPSTAAETAIEEKFPQEAYGQNLRNAMEGLIAAVQSSSSQGFAP